MNDDDKNTNDSENGEESPTEQTSETAQMKDYFERVKNAFTSLEEWENIADVTIIKSLLTDRRLTQSQKESLMSILTGKAKQMKMGTEFKKIVALVKKELSKDNEYQRGSYNIINFSDGDCAIVLASRDFYCDGNAIRRTIMRAINIQNTRRNARCTI